MTKRQRAIQLRDLALPLIRARGSFHSPIKVVGPYKPLIFQSDDIIIMYRSPFQKLPGTSGKVLKECHRLGVPPLENLPHGLDISAHINGRHTKVLNIEWDDNGDVHLRSYKAGEWERHLEALAITVAA